MCFPRGAATPDVTIKLKLGDNMFGFCHRKRGGHDCAEARSCGGEGCPISKEMREAGLISLRRMKEGQKARIAHVQASGELGRRIRDMGLIPGAEVEVVGRAPLRDPVALRLPGFTLSPAGGGIYLFPGVGPTGLTSAEACERILEEAHVLMLPGSAFGDAGEGYLRIACTVGLDKMEEAFGRMAQMPMLQGR